MFTAVSDFLATWREEAAATSRVLGALTDASLRQRSHPNARSVGELAWHLVQSLREISRLTGLAIDGPTKPTPLPDTVEYIRLAYERTAASLASTVEENWSDRTLIQTDEVYGMSWPRGKTLFVLLCHEIHHRGQLTR